LRNFAANTGLRIRKLDATGKGYVSKEDVKDLSGFEAAFQSNDTTAS